MLTPNRLLNFELIVLSMLLIVLPSLETPKTLFWLIYFVTFLIRRYRDFTPAFGKPDLASLSIAGLFLVSLVSTIVNWPLESGFSGAMDIFIHCSLALALMHAGYTKKQLLFIAGMIITGTLVGLWFGTLEYASGITRSLGFHSAGVTTQSSIYLGIVIILILGLLADKSAARLPITILLLVSAYLLTIGLIYMGSRGALLAVILCTGLLLILQRNLRFLLMTMTVALLAIGTASHLLKEYPSNMNQQEYRERLSLERFKKSDNERLENWRVAVAWIKQGNEPVWGIGPKNYPSIDPDELGIKSSFYERTGEMHHAHNLFLTRWVEQGLAGITVMLLFYLLVAYRLLKSWPYCRQQCTWIWTAGLGALLVPMIAGFFNTPFYQEHAMLAMILLGSMLGKTQPS